MESKYSAYDIDASADRIDDILLASNKNFEEVNSIPTRDKLTFTNGFYVNCTCVAIDIRKSADLPSKYKRPTLAKIYRAFISEAVAIFCDSTNCREVNIHGDSVWGVFDTPYKTDIDDAFSTTAKLSSMVDLLNCRFKKKTSHIDPIRVGIGIDYGRALMIKSGAKGSGINEVVWMGDVVNKATKLCHNGNRNWDDREIMVSKVIYQNLNDHNKGLLSYNQNRYCYHGNVINTSMNDWIKENCA